MTANGSWWAVALASASGNTLVWGSLGLSVLLVAVRWWLMQKPSQGLRSPLGEVNWSFSNSWASNLTAVSAFLGTILAATVVPADAVPFSPGALAGLNLLFGFINLLAPLAFSAVARINRPAAGDPAPDYVGYIGLFLLAVALTVWATLGELATIAILLNELQAGTLSSALTWLFLALLLISVASIASYAWVTIEATVTYVPPPANPAPPGPDGVVPPVERTPLPRWNLL